MLKTLNLEGDRQADLTVHGGPDKAVYAYPMEHYGYWREVFPTIEMQNGTFGENFTTEGLMEGDVCIGDVFRIGSSQVIATQPRMPCYKLGVKFGRMDVLKKFIVRLYTRDKEDVESMRRAVKVEALPKGWKHHLFEQIKLVEKNKGRNKRK